MNRELRQLIVLMGILLLTIITQTRVLAQESGQIESQSTQESIQPSTEGSQTISETDLIPEPSPPNEIPDYSHDDDRQSEYIDIISNPETPTGNNGLPGQSGTLQPPESGNDEFENQSSDGRVSTSVGEEESNPETESSETDRSSSQEMSPIRRKRNAQASANQSQPNRATRAHLSVITLLRNFVGQPAPEKDIQSSQPGTLVQRLLAHSLLTQHVGQRFFFFESRMIHTLSETYRLFLNDIFPYWVWQ